MTMSTLFPHRPTRATRSRGIAAMLAVAAASVVTAPAALADDDLTQTIDPDQAQGTGPVVLDHGHIDIGPTLGTGELLLEAHDDTGDTSVWRQLSDVVVRVNDQAVMTMPDDDTYSFIGLKPGDPVWMIPQTQQPEVAWLGWNTQEPQLMQTISGGATFSLVGVEGPGDMVVFLQSGNFGAPQVVWTSREPVPQDSWIEVNTHTHANWAFTQPGDYLVRLQVSATTLAGEEISTEDTLRVAVGSDADTAAAFAAQWDGDQGAPGVAASGGDQAASDGGVGAPAAAQSDAGASAADASSDSGQGDMQRLLLIGAGVVVLALLVAAVAFVVSGRRARRLVWESRHADDGGPAPHDTASPDGGAGR